MMMQWDQASLPPQQVILVGGSTASGKSGWTMNTIMASGSPHRHCIINADSMQIYDALDTLIAAPTVQEKALVSHHVYGVANAYEGAIGVAKWRTWVHDAINQALANNQRPWVVGGTGFYLRTLCDGLSPIPDMKASEVHHWRQHYASIPLHDVHQQLALVDVQSAQRLKDTQRIIHALIVKQLTGRSLSWWHQHPKSQSPYSFFKILHWPSAADLNHKVMTRWAHMVDNGVVQDVQDFCSDPRWRSSPLAKALGVRTIDHYVQQRMSWSECQETYVMETAKYIKRQRTWFRWQYQPDMVVGPYGEMMVDQGQNHSKNQVSSTG